MAAGLGPMALGSDGGGSIRIPASFNGIFGMKPSLGRVANYPSSPVPFLVHAGPMTRTVHDAALLLNVIAGPDERDLLSLPAEATDYLAACEGGVRGGLEPGARLCEAGPRGREIVDQRSRPNNLGVIQRHSLSSARQYASVDAMTVIQ